MKEIKSGQIWVTNMPIDHGYIRLKITGVGNDKILAYEQPWPHELNTIETDVTKRWLLDNCKCVGYENDTRN